MKIYTPSEINFGEADVKKGVYPVLPKAEPKDKYTEPGWGSGELFRLSVFLYSVSQDLWKTF